MKWFNDLQMFLDGKKSIVMAIVGGLDYTGAQLGWWSSDSIRQGVEVTLYGVFMRLGVTKSGPPVAAPAVLPPPASVQ